MSIQLHRKQVIMLVLAMLLAIASYWIPLPQQPASSQEQPKLSEPAEKTMLEEPLAFARESTTPWRFPITVAIPRTTRPELMARSGEPYPAPSLVAEHLIDVREIGNDDALRLNVPAFVPIKDLERPFR
jgi:hypothetical protein